MIKMARWQKCSNCGEINYILTHRATHCIICGERTMKKNRWKERKSKNE